VNRVGLPAERRAGDVFGARGIALVEVLLAGALFATVLVAVFPLFLSSQKSNVAADAYSRANALAREGLEHLLDLPFDDPRLAAGAHSATDLPRSRRDPETGLPSAAPNPFRRSYRVLQFSIPDGAAVPRGSPFRPAAVRQAGLRFEYKRIDVTVEPALAAPELGIAAARVSAILENPEPEAILSAADPEP
jgi:type II secretory pathway pseudopilin PulG